MTVVTGATDLTAATILGQTWQLVLSNGARAAIAIAALSLAGGLDDFGIGGSATTLVVTVLMLFLQYWLTRSLLEDLGLRFGSGPRFVAFVVQGLLVGIAFLIGFFLLIVPAIIVFVRWSISGPSLVASDQSITEALGESWRQTQGHFWPILLAFIAVYVPPVTAAILAVLADGSPLGQTPGIAATMVFELSINTGLVLGWHATVAIYAMFERQRGVAEVFA